MARIERVSTYVLRLDDEETAVLSNSLSKLLSACQNLGTEAGEEPMTEQVKAAWEHLRDFRDELDTARISDG